MRSIPIDVMRTASMLYIVGFWHLFTYANVGTEYYNPVTIRLTLATLALFVLISGYLLGGKPIKLNRADLTKFYKSRFLRIYIPFLIACGLFYAAHINDAHTLIKGALLIALFDPPAPFTLWFIDLIVLFYLIAPLLIALREKTVFYFVLCFVVIAAFFLYQFLTGKLDTRLILYFPCFAAGVFLARKPLPISPAHIFLLMLAAIVALVPIYGHPVDKLESDVWAMPWTLCSSIAIFIAFMHLSRKWASFALLSYLSEASFFMYLLHRPIFVWMTTLWTPDTGKMRLIYLWFVCLPLIALAAFFAQRRYTNIALLNRSAMR